MSKSFKWFAVLAVALPLWFIAWRMYDEWRVESAWHELRANFEIQREYATLQGDPPGAQSVYDRAKYLQRRYGEYWLVRRFPHPGP